MQNGPPGAKYTSLLYKNVTLDSSFSSNHWLKIKLEGSQYSLPNEGWSISSNISAIGARVVLPTHQGEATVSFNLHNRHTYSEDEVEAGRAFASYTAEIAVASFEGDVLGRRFIQSEFRSGDDLVDRITGGAGPRGLKAISPTGTERVFVKIPGELNEVFIVGQSLQVLRTEAHESIVDAGRTVAVISDVRVDYQP